MAILYVIIGIIIYLAIGGFVAGLYGDMLDESRRKSFCVIWPIVVFIYLFLSITKPFIKLGRKLSPFKPEEDEDK